VVADLMGDESRLKDAHARILAQRHLLFGHIDPVFALEQFIEDAI